MTVGWDPLRSKNSKEEVALLNPVPKKIITNKIEEYLQLCIISMQINGILVLRNMVLVKGNDIYCLMYGITIKTGFLG